MTVSIALSPTGFALTVPSVLEGRSHAVEVPANEAGIRMIRKILLAQEQEERRTIGTVASPTQTQVEAWLRQDKIARAEERARAEAEKETKLADAAKAIIGDVDLGALDL